MKNYLHVYFQLLKSERLPRLHKVMLRCRDSNLPSSTIKELLEILRDFNPSVVKLTSDRIELECCLLNSQSYCKVILDTNDLEIVCEKVDAAVEEKPKRTTKRFPFFNRR